MDYKMEEAKTAEQGLATWDMLCKVPLAVSTHQQILGNFLLGRTRLMLGYKGESVVGCMFFEVVNQDVHVLALYLPGQLKHFWPLFVQWCRERKLNKLVAASIYDPERYKRLFDMDALYTVYTKEL